MKVWKNRTENINKYRWVVLFFACIINLFSGVIYAWSVFSEPMQEHMEMTYGLALLPGSLAIVYTMANVSSPLAQIIGGKINDKIGPKPVILVGSVFYGAGMYFSAYADSVGMMIFTYGIIMGIGLAIIYGSNVGAVIKLFPDHKGLVGGLVTATYGCSSVMTSLIAGRIIENQGVVTAFKEIGVIYSAVIFVSALFLIKPPEKVNKETSVVLNGFANDCNWKQMITDKRFYYMFVMFFCGTMVPSMCVSQASAIAQNMVGFSASAATVAVSVLGLFNALSRIVTGTLSDAIGRTNTLVIGYATAIAALTGLYFTQIGMNRLFMVSIVCIGFSFGVFMSVFPGFTADVFGTKHNSTNYGVMFFALAAGTFAGPMLLKNIYAASGSYDMAFIIAMPVAAVGILTVILYNRMIHRQKHFKELENDRN